MITAERRYQLWRSKPKNHEERLHDALLRLKEFILNSAKADPIPKRGWKPPPMYEVTLRLTPEQISYIVNLVHGGKVPRNGWPTEHAYLKSYFEKNPPPYLKRVLDRQKRKSRL